MICRKRKQLGVSENYMLMVEKKMPLDQCGDISLDLVYLEVIDDAFAV
jgi:hypothetical protein